MRSSGTLTVAELARRMGLSNPETEERLRLLERLGYLERVSACQAEGEEGGGCDRCGHWKGCGNHCRRSFGAGLAFYRLTEKGMRLLAIGT